MPLILKIIIAVAILYGLTQLAGLKDTLNEKVHENDRGDINQLNYIDDNSSK